MDVEKLNIFMNKYKKKVLFIPKENGIELNIIDNLVENNDIYFIPKHEKVEDVLNEIIDKYPLLIC